MDDDDVIDDDISDVNRHATDDADIAQVCSIEALAF